MSNEASEEVILLKERFIPVSKDQFLSLLLNKFESDREKQLFGQLCGAIECLFYVNRISKIENFKQSYAPFSRLSGIKTKQNQLSNKELSIRQTKLMKMIYDTLTDAHFEAITFEMYKNSIEKVFLSDLPIKVDWPKLDSFLLTKFYQQYPSMNPYQNLKHKPPFYQHFAMFYRGYGLCVRKGLFLAPKLNLVLADLFPIIQSYITQFIRFMTVTLFKSKNKNKNKNKDKPKNVSNSNKSIYNEHVDLMKLERISLLDTYNTAKTKGIRHTAWWFLKNITIQEPTFKRLIMVYRHIPESFVQEQTRKIKERANKLKNKLEISAKKQLGLKQKGKEDNNNNNNNKQLSEGIVDEIGRKRKASLFDTPDLKPTSKSIDDTYLYPIRIQYFSDIPMSDLEITYPCKQFSLKPMDQIYITFTIFIGIWAIIKELVFNGASTAFGSFMILTAIFLMIRSIIWYRSTESEYVRVLNQALVESNISTDQDTMLSLMDSVDTQQFMETILAYFVLLKNKDEIITDSDGVDRLCEKFMREEFGSDINVMIEGAMTKLTELGLFKSGGMSIEESIKVKELLDALSCAHQHYQSAIQSVRKITMMKQDQDDQKRDIQDKEINDNDGIMTTPPIIGASQISDDHFDGGNNNNNDDEFTPID